MASGGVWFREDLVLLGFLGPRGGVTLGLFLGAPEVVQVAEVVAVFLGEAANAVVILIQRGRIEA